MHKQFWCGVAIFLASCGSPLLAGDAFRVQLSSQLRYVPDQTRLYLFFSSANPQADRAEPRFGPDWFHPQPFVAMDVQGLKAGTEVVIRLSDPEVKSFPPGLNAEQVAGRRVQAVARLNPRERRLGDGPGNGYGAVQPVEGAVTTLSIDHVVEEQPYPQSEWSREFNVPTGLVSTFYGYPVDIKSTVTLPPSYPRDPQRRYPVILEVPGFGGTHRSQGAVRQAPVRELNSLGVEFIRVMLDANCPRGHHCFANSDNNGPWHTALVQEFLPALDAAFRTTGAPQGRFLTGHSSGGWSTLWILINAPESFAGVWSTAPDPVDFRDFQQINLYAGDNMFRDVNGQRRPLARMDGQPIVWYEDFSQMEEVLGPGGQLHSFEAVFSESGADGRPRRLWNRSTGDVDPHCVTAWRRYDISQILHDRWEELRPQLSGKLHIFMGTEDTFYLESSTVLLGDRLQELGSDADVTLISGRTHFDLFQGGLRARIEQEMAQMFVNADSPVLQNN